MGRMRAHAGPTIHPVGSVRGSALTTHGLNPDTANSLPRYLTSPAAAATHPSRHPSTPFPTDRRHSVLPGACLCDDALLGHALAQQCLPECVVDLVRAGVVEVLAFQIDEGHAAVSPEWGRENGRRGMLPLALARGKKAGEQVPDEEWAGVARAPVPESKTDAATRARRAGVLGDAPSPR